MSTRQPYRGFPRGDDDLILCPLDNTPIKDHTRCVVCSILIGEKHHMRHAHTVDGKVICTECRQRLIVSAARSQ